MSYSRWRRHPDEDVAIDELLDAAGRAFAELGVSKATMTDVARYAGCSRATLYRYFPNQSALHMAFVHRATLRIATRLAEERGGERTSLTERIVDGIAAVRADPLLAVWFEPENMSVPLAVSRDSTLLRELSMGALGGDSDGDGDSELDSTQMAEIELRAAWLMRAIVSLLATPADSDATERAMIEHFVVPVLLPESDHPRSHT